MKQRIVIRLHLAVRAVLQSEADWRGTRPVRGAELRVEPRQQPLYSRYKRDKI